MAERREKKRRWEYKNLNLLRTRESFLDEVKIVFINFLSVQTFCKKMKKLDSALKIQPDWKALSSL